MAGWMDEAQPWREQAACRGEGVDRAVFFAEPVVGAVAGSRRREQEAKAVCRRCPVARPCLEHALAVPERHGIWGMLTAKERSRLARQRRAG